VARFEGEARVKDGSVAWNGGGMIRTFVPRISGCGTGLTEALDRARKVFELMGDARGLELCRVPL
jgi:hypothetical protein